MGESGTVKSSARLEVSISFGRYEGDGLSWEKWSSFSPNKYLEEVRNLSTPGSVAQKKAYFEAHYRRITTARANAHGSDEVGNSDDHAKDPSTDAESGLPSGNELVEEADKMCRMDLSTMKVINADEGEKSTAIAEEKTNDGSVIEEPKLDVGLEAALVGLVNSPEDGSRRIAGKASEREEMTTIKRENVARKISGTPNKEVQPSPAPSPRKVMAKSNSVPTFASRSQKKVGESKNAGQSSSMGPAPASASSALSMTKKSLTMKKTQEKDIVKQAVKSSYNRASRSSTDEKISTAKQFSSTTSVPKRSTPLTQAKGRTGLRRDSKKIAAQSNNQSESRLKPLPSSSYKSSKKKFSTDVSPSVDLRSDARMEKRKEETSVDLRSDARMEKRKEFLKKLEAKSIAREAAKTQLRANSKEEKELRLETPTESQLQGQTFAIILPGSKKSSFRRG